MVRRRRDQSDPGRRVPRLGDPRVHLVGGKLAALARFGTLRHLDLQVVGVDQVLARDAEPAARDLLDGRAAQVAAGVGQIAVGVLAALARVGPAAEPVHRDRQGLVCLGRQGAVRHGSRHEPLDDLADRFDLVQRDRQVWARFVDAADREQAAQGHQPRGLLVNLPGVRAEDFSLAGSGRVLQQEDGLRAEQVRRSAPAPLVLAANLKFRPAGTGGPARIGAGHAGGVVGGNLIEADAAEPGCGPGKAFADHLGAEPDRLEYLRSCVGGDGGHAHLGHDLQQALAERLDQVRRRLAAGDRSEQTRARHVLDRLNRQVRADRRGAVADQQGDMMCLPDVSGLDHQAHPGTGPVPDQMVVHRAGQQQRRDRRPVGGVVRWRRRRRLLTAAHRGAPVGEHDNLGARRDCLRDFRPDLGQPRAQGLAAAGGEISPVDNMRGEAGQVAVFVDVDDLCQVVVADHRVGQHDLTAGRGPRLEDVVLRAGRRGERGNKFLPDGIQRRVGYLRELLGEVVED